MSRDVPWCLRLLRMSALCIVGALPVMGLADVVCPNYTEEQACTQYSGPPNAPYQKGDGGWYKCVWMAKDKRCNETLTVTYDVYFNFKIVQPGDTGPNVITIQKLLEKQHYSVIINGNFDTSTEDAVKGFQKKAGLKKIDGKVGKETLEALLK